MRPVNLARRWQCAFRNWTPVLWLAAAAVARADHGADPADELPLALMIAVAVAVLIVALALHRHRRSKATRPTGQRDGRS